MSVFWHLAESSSGLALRPLLGSPLTGSFMSSRLSTADIFRLDRGNSRTGRRLELRQRAARNVAQPLPARQEQRPQGTLCSCEYSRRPPCESRFRNRHAPA
jgi:hypothetical protein